MKWLMTNRPLGARIKSNFAGKKESVYCELILDNGAEIEAARSDKMFYALNGQQYTGVGTEVPDVVVQALNMSELNTQEQLDQHFLITSSAGEVARVVNRVTKIEQADKWVSALTTEVNTLNRSIDSTGVALAAEMETIKKYDNVPYFDADVVIVEGLNKEYKKTVLLIDGLHNVIEDVKKTSARIDHHKRFDGAEERLLEVTRLVNGFKDSLLESVAIVHTMAASEVVQVLQEDIEDLSPDVTQLEAMLAAVKQDNDEISALGTIVGSINTVKERLGAADARFGAVANNFREYLSKLGRCPFCFGEITEDRVVQIMEVR
jgi:hypothetical protein